LDLAVPIEEFFTSIDGATHIGKLEESDQIMIAVLKLTDAARLFYNGCPELHEKNVTWQMFESVFSQRFKDTHTQISITLCSYKPRDTKMSLLNNLRIGAVLYRRK